VNLLKVVNLEEGLPTVEQARQKMLRELEGARRSGNKGVKLIHGYGSSGVGGEIRLAVGSTLQQMKQRGEISAVVFGENWAVSDSDTWARLQRYPILKQDCDLGRKNRGITVVWF
jgi:DNA-nicking Smr family endonuclease